MFRRTVWVNIAGSVIAGDGPMGLWSRDAAKAQETQPLGT